MSVPCPECRTPCAPTANRCPGCGFPLILQHRTAGEEHIDRRLFVQPGRRDDPDDGPPPAGRLGAGPSSAGHPVAGTPYGGRPVPPRTTAVPGERRAPVRPHGATPAATIGDGDGRLCPSCRRRNPPQRLRWCAWCAGELAVERPAPLPVPASSQPPRRRGLGWLVAAAVVVTVVIVAGWAFLAGRGT